MIYLSLYIQEQLDKIPDPKQHLLITYDAVLTEHNILFNDIKMLLKFAKDFNL